MNSSLKFFTMVICIGLLLIVSMSPVLAQDTTPQPTPESSQETSQDSFKMGLEYYYQKDFQKSQDYFLEALKQDPQNVMALSFYLDSNYKLNNLVSAVNQIEQKSIDAGNNPSLKAQVGIGYISRGLLDPNMLQEALSILKEVLKTNPELANANTGMGMVYFHKRLIPRAKGYFIKALKSNPKDLMALEILGDILMIDEKNPQDALIFFNKVIELAPNYSDGYFNAASANEKLGNKKEAIRLFEKCMEIDKKGVLKGYYAPIRVGDIYLKDKDWNKAEYYYKVALKINPKNPLAKTLLKKAQSKGKEWKGKKVNRFKKKIKDINN